MGIAHRGGAFGLALMLAGIAHPTGGVVAQDADVWLRGAGATFPAPLYQSWIASYQAAHPEIQITYDPVGSGEGTNRFITGSVDFGASDAALTDEEIAAVERGVRLIPATAGMVVLAYNLPGVGPGLKLTRDAYANIFDGDITSWDDPRIAETNPDIELPDLSITIVARRDSSGTTLALTNHLSAVSGDWREGPGIGKRIDWPGPAMTAPGNHGVAGLVKLSEGSIGYVGYEFARRLDLPMAVLENQAGRFVEPGAESGRSALAEAIGEAGDSDLRLVVADPKSEDAYPIVTFSWLMLYDSYDDAPRQQALVDFVSWGLTEGQGPAAEMGYIPLADQVVARSLEALKDGN